MADPTTWAPVGLYWPATQGDWVSSWVLFRRGGYVEGNHEFTISGKSCDTPINFGAGSRKIAIYSAEILGYSILINASAQAGEHFLNKRFPAHKRFLATIGWIVRIGGGVVLAKNALPHLAQWQKNGQL